MNNDYVSVDEAAAELSVSRGTLWKWIKRQELPTFRFLGERRTFIRRADLDQLRGPIPVDITKKVAA